MTPTAATLTPFGSDRRAAAAFSLVTHLVLEGSWRFGRRRCRYALISTRLSLPKCRVSYWASINCLLRSRLPWCSAAFQSNESSTSSFSTTQLLFIRLKKPCAFCINQLLCPPPPFPPRTNCSGSCAHAIARLSAGQRGLDGDLGLTG